MDKVKPYDICPTCNKAVLTQNDAIEYNELVNDYAALQAVCEELAHELGETHAALTFNPDGYTNSFRYRSNKSALAKYKELEK